MSLNSKKSFILNQVKAKKNMFWGSCGMLSLFLVASWQYWEYSGNPQQVKSNIVANSALKSDLSQLVEHYNIEPQSSFDNTDHSKGAPYVSVKPAKPLKNNQLTITPTPSNPSLNQPKSFESNSANPNSTLSQNPGDPFGTKNTSPWDTQKPNSNAQNNSIFGTNDHTNTPSPTYNGYTPSTPNNQNSSSTPTTPSNPGVNFNNRQTPSSSPLNTNILSPGASSFYNPAITAPSNNNPTTAPSNVPVSPQLNTTYPSNVPVSPQLNTTYPSNVPVSPQLNTTYPSNVPVSPQLNTTYPSNPRVPGYQKLQRDQYTTNKYDYTFSGTGSPANNSSPYSYTYSGPANQNQPQPSNAGVNNLATPYTNPYGVNLRGNQVNPSVTPANINPYGTVPQPSTVVPNQSNFKTPYTGSNFK